jgi:hypothetical protein
MKLFLRKVIHPRTHDNYRVILKDDGVDIEVGSIGVQHGGWVWVLIPSSRRKSWKQRAVARIEKIACASSERLGQ